MVKEKQLIRKSIFIFFILLPIINTLRNTWIKNIELLGISILELINIIIILFATILNIINLKRKQKSVFSLIIYTLLIIIYTIFHNLNILRFNSQIYIWTDINIVKETYYIIRSFYIPVLLLFVLIKNKDIFNKDFYLKVIKSLIIIISGSIVLLNVFKLSFATYDYNNTKFINYNVFNYYKSNESAKLLSTKGWFASGNEISAILIMLLPINAALLIKENKKFNIFLYILQFLSMIIIGTKVSSFGAILVSIISITINVISYLKKRIAFNYKLLISSVICILYFFISPVGTFYLKTKTPYYQSHDVYSEELKILTAKKDIINYISNHLEDFRIDKYFVYIYPIENDVDFWYEIALRDRNLNNDFRNLKTAIIKRVKQRNNNFGDTLFGFGYTSNFIELERDYIYQYYLFGICGIIFIVPEIMVLFESGVYSITNLKKYKTSIGLLLLMSPLLGLVVAYFTGHVFGWISSTYILCLVLALLYDKSIMIRK